MRKLFLFLLPFLLLFASCKQDDSIDTNTELDQELEAALIGNSNGEGIDYFKFPQSDDYANIPQDPNNPITAAKVELGELLFHETALGVIPENGISLNTYSCASCHFASAGFQAGRWQGIGEGGIGFGINGEGRVRGSLYTGDDLDVQPLRTPTAMNTAYQEVMLWSGTFGSTGVNEGTEYAWTIDTPKESNYLGFMGPETQAIAGLKVHRMAVDDNLLDNLGYRVLFDAAFGDRDEDVRYTRLNAGLAIAAYERTILANQAPFQKWLNGDKTAMGDSEKRGAVLFFTQGKCGNCHTGPALSETDFHALGMGDLHMCPEETFQAPEDSPANLGRAQFTGLDEDKFKFKTPQLYNLTDSKFFGHGSSHRSIKEVVEYFNNGVPQMDIPEGQLAEEFTSLNLSEQDIEDITAFLAESLYDSNLARYQPEATLSGGCIPMNDPLAASQLGCN